MTGSRTTICSKCGYSNVPGDEFCGSCGTFLEWVAADADPGPVVIGDEGPVVAPPPPNGGGAAPVTVIPDPEPIATTTPTAALVRCPACGIANPGDRTFCQSCGNKLTETTRVEMATPEQIAKAVASTGTGPVVQQRSARDTPEDGGSSSGILKWLVVLGLVGVVVGVVAVVGMNFLRTPGRSDSTNEPQTAVPSGGSAPSSEPAPPTTPVEPPAAGLLTITDVDASSKTSNDRFAPKMVADGNLGTAWKEGAKDAAGEHIEVVFAPSTVTAILVTNGFTSADVPFKRNPRLKEIEITVGDAAPITKTLRDATDEQLIQIEPPVGNAERVRITIVSTYGNGAKTDTAALSEIKVLGVTAP